MPEALSALESNRQVEVTTDRWFAYRPANEDPEAGLILYPGGRVDPRSYAPAARAIAADGYVVVVVPMPLNLAVLGADKAAEVITAYPELEYWAVGGHSLGGAMAARFAHSRSSLVDGLVLWAAYPDASNDLSGSELAVTSIYGTLDGLATEQKIAASRSLLPPHTQWVAIKGGNHAQFGWYGPQAGDNPAAISGDEQQQKIVDATVELLAGLSE
ncbi:MAG: alpha/beta hydrolase [Anaerolineae bacterium]|nr:alpha/beta hydrolase [Anaerolineae bacterium]NIN94749.1 alpha/beta hydrolase [Anaerolineae bacterium]NIQ77831.1 alpha/beta hydrolase [Anaerolineae bacterium]